MLPLQLGQTYPSYQFRPACAFRMPQQRDQADGLGDVAGDMRRFICSETGRRH